MISITNEEFNLLRNYIEDSCGICIGDGKSYLVQSKLSKIIDKAGFSTFMEFYRKAKNEPRFGFRDKIVDAMTTNETLWFRDQTPFIIFREVLLPQYLDEIKKGSRSKIRIWSAASSTGQEPYSIAIEFLEFMEKNSLISPANLEILGTDICSSAIFLAMNAKYDSFKMNRGMPEYYKNKYFDYNGRVYALKSEVKRLVTFKNFNLQKGFDILGSFDIIFCRNVAIYFSPEFKKKLFTKIAKSLNPKGHIFIGASENIMDNLDKYEKLSYKKGYYYMVNNV